MLPLYNEPNASSEISRKAGLAEISTNILHNVGNILNSVAISADLLQQKLRDSKIVNIAKLSEILNQNKSTLDSFFSEDNRGVLFPVYLEKLSELLLCEYQAMVQEAYRLCKNIDHIKSIIVWQQSYAGSGGAKEKVSPANLIRDAVMIDRASLERHNVIVEYNMSDVPDIEVERHKIMQILVNLITNAKNAIDEGKVELGTITFVVESPDPDSVAIHVDDNGIGIPENIISKIFQSGFTTRKTGHGFGLHSCALLAKEIGGSIHAYSGGIGKGARFTLTVPSIKT